MDVTKDLEAQSDLPWLCAGDFNEIIFQFEEGAATDRIYKWTGSERPQTFSICRTWCLKASLHGEIINLR